jgi:hypothetical protein
MPVKSQLVGGYYSLFRFFPVHEPVQPLQPHPQPPPFFFFFQMLLKASAAAANIIRPTAAVDTILLAANAIQTPSCSFRLLSQSDIPIYHNAFALPALTLDRFTCSRSLSL